MKLTFFFLVHVSLAPTFVSCFGVYLGDLGCLQGRLRPEEKQTSRQWMSGNGLPSVTPPSVGLILLLVTSEAAFNPPLLTPFPSFFLVLPFVGGFCVLPIFITAE